jgi:hypothetical protein
MALDPVNSPLDRLFVFWEAYDKEYTNLLKHWHDDTAAIRRPVGQVRSTGNVLYDSFLDTWAEGEFENNLPLEQKTYFSAIGVVSKGLRDQCTKVLDQVLKRVPGGEATPGGRYVVPLQLVIDRSAAESKAQDTIKDILKPFSLEHANLKDKIDPFVADAVNAANQDPYLEALQRMMNIETKSFGIQKEFLESGNAPTESA